MPGVGMSGPLVVLGASRDVAAAAAALPVPVVHVRMPGAPRPADPAAVAYSVDYQHPPAFLPFVDEVLAPLKPVAVVSLTELGLEPASAAAERLGVTGVPLEAVRDTRDKLRMRRLLAREAPHLNPPYAPGDAPPDEVAALFARGAGVVAKPVAGTGSLAVALLRRPGDLPTAGGARAPSSNGTYPVGSSASRRCPAAGATGCWASRRNGPHRTASWSWPT